VRVVMLHPVRVPPASGSLPTQMFPREIPSAALHDAVTSTLRQAAPAPAQFLASLSLAFSARNMPPASRAAVSAFPRFRSAPPPPASPPPQPQRVPHPTSIIAFILHAMTPAPRRIPVANSHRICRKTIIHKASSDPF
jgi:hypothetical protein